MPRDYQLEAAAYLKDVERANAERRNNPKIYTQLDVNAPKFSPRSEITRQAQAVDQANTRAPWEQDTSPSSTVAPWEEQPSAPWEGKGEGEIVDPRATVSDLGGVSKPVYQRGDKSYTASELPGLAFEGVKDLLTPRTTMEDVLSPSYWGNMGIGGMLGGAAAGPLGAVAGILSTPLVHELYKRELDKFKSLGYTEPDKAAQASTGILTLGTGLVGGGGRGGLRSVSPPEAPPPLEPPRPTNPLTPQSTGPLTPGLAPQSTQFGMPQPQVPYAPRGGPAQPYSPQNSLYPSGGGGNVGVGAPIPPIRPPQLPTPQLELPLTLTPQARTPGLGAEIFTPQTSLYRDPLAPEVSAIQQETRRPGGRLLRNIPKERGDIPLPPREGGLQELPPPQEASPSRPIPGQTLLPFDTFPEVRAARPAIQLPVPEPVVGEMPTAKTAPQWKKWWQQEMDRWGKETSVINNAPDSPVLTATEGVNVYPELMLDDHLRLPWVQKLLHPKGMGWWRQTFDRKALQEESLQWETIAKKAEQDWIDGGRTEAARLRAIEQMPPEFQEMQHFLETRLALDNVHRKEMGLPPIPRFPGPYFPRTTTQEFKETRSLYSGGGGGAVRSTIGSHGEARGYETLSEGLAKGVEYKDLRASYLSRVVKSLQLETNYKMVQGLKETGIIHETEEAAKLASPTGEVMRLPKGTLGFSPESNQYWWVRTHEEGKFLAQNFKPTTSGEWARIANTYFRNPSLVIPYPHAFKNMYPKLLLTTWVHKGNLLKLHRDMVEYGSQSNPALIAEFEKYMPFTRTGKSVQALVDEHIPRGPLESVENALGKLNVWSQKKIFAQYDPAMRYAGWKSYKAQGMSSQQAANNVAIDLIRYGTRSMRIDGMKSLVMNFFVPWRVGAVRTYMKAFRTNPMRAAMFVAATDFLREMDYRATGRWVHMPQDYIERPLAHLFEKNGTGALSTILATAIAGPGGEYYFRSMQTLMTDLQMRGETKDLNKLFWGLSMIFDAVPEFQKAQQASSRGDYGKASQHFLNIMGLITLGRHATPYGGPGRLGQIIPESIMPKSAITKQGEQRGAEARGERPKGDGMPRLPRMQ